MKTIKGFSISTDNINGSGVYRYFSITGDKGAIFTLEIKNDEDGLTKVIIVDDVYATGGTAKATRDLCEEAGYDVVDEIFLINLFYVNNNSRVKSVLTYK